MAAWEKAARLDPYGLTFPLRIFKALMALDRREQAKVWAQRLLELDRLQRLDPLKGLTEEERSQAARALRDP